MDLPPVESMSPAEIAAELALFENTHGFVRPSRSSTAEDPSLPWLFGQPNYDKADLVFFRGRSYKHPNGSLQAIVEDAVKTWEFEASHLPFSAWSSVQHDAYRVISNSSKLYKGEEGAKAGNYNWLLAGVDKKLYDSEKETFHTSHEMFRGAFLSGFPFEVIEVFSPPPIVAFTWRHWANFNGVYKGRNGDGKTYEMYGFGVLDLNKDLKIQQIQIFYKPEEFLKAVQGEIDPETLTKGKQLVGDGCPFLSGLRKAN